MPPAAIEKKPDVPTTLTPDPPDEVRPIEWAKDLIEVMALHHTGKQTINFCKEAIALRYYADEHKNKPDLHPDRHLTSQELIRALEQEMLNSSNFIADLTVHKARSLMMTGTWAWPKDRGHLADEIKAAPKSKAPERKLPDLVKPEFVELEGDGQTFGPKQIKGAKKADVPKLG